MIQGGIVGGYYGNNIATPHILTAAEAKNAASQIQGLLSGETLKAAIDTHIPHGGHRPHAIFFLTGQTERVPITTPLRAFPVQAGLFGNTVLLSFDGSINEHKYGGNTAITVTFGNLDDESNADWTADGAEDNSFFQISPAMDYQIEFYLIGSQTGDSNATLMLTKIREGTDDIVLRHRPGAQNPIETGLNTIYEFFLDDVAIKPTDKFYWQVGGINNTTDAQRGFTGYMTIRQL